MNLGARDPHWVPGPRAHVADSVLTGVLCWPCSSILGLSRGAHGGHADSSLDRKNRLMGENLPGRDLSKPLQHSSSGEKSSVPMEISLSSSLESQSSTLLLGQRV